MAQLPPGQVPADTELVLQMTDFTESPGSDHATLKVTFEPAGAGSGLSEAETIVGAPFCTVKVPDDEDEQALDASQANA